MTPTGTLPQAAPRGGRFPGWARSLLCVLVLASLPAAVLSPLWEYPLSAGEDDVIYYYPLRVLAGRAISDGHWPMHNPWEATGMPLMADTQSAVMYPPTWLFAWLDGPMAYSLNIFLGFAIAGVGAWVYLRRLGLWRAPSFTGALAFTFCGFLVGHRVHLAMLHTAAFLPWLLWCIELARARRDLAYLAGVLVAYLTITSGHWGIALQMGVGVAAYHLLRARPLGKATAVLLAAAGTAVALVWPMIAPALATLGQSTRESIGYAIVGENSFLPLSAVLLLFPMLMGSRTPGFYPHDWWGPWHLCETLPYVGLVTLVLAAAAVWKLYRRTGRNATDPGEAGVAPHRPIVRVWTWLAIGSAVWMLGYYLPTYRLITWLPVLGRIRCPARMLLVLDLALSVLAAVGMQAVLGRHRKAGKAAARVARRWLPAVMAVSLLAIAAGAGLLILLFPWPVPLPFGGTRHDALQSLNPVNPAVWVPLLLCAATAGVVTGLVRRPARWRWAVGLLLLADLTAVARFVDISPAEQRPPDRLASPAADWLHRNEGDGQWRVWGLGRHYHDRPAELLLPKTSAVHRIRSIASYGPWQSPRHAHVLGFNHYGRHPQWRWLLRTNHLLSLYDVRYILAADPEYRREVEAIRVLAPSEPGPELLSDRWELRHARRDGNRLRLEGVFLWQEAEIRQRVSVAADQTVRLSLEVRAPEGSAALWTKAELFWFDQDGTWRWSEKMSLLIEPEQVASQWRRYAATLEVDPAARGEMYLRVYSKGERPIEVRNVSLRSAEPFAPVLPPEMIERLGEGTPVYELAAELPAVRDGDPPVGLYRNRLALPATLTKESRHDQLPHGYLEAIKWSPETLPDWPELEAPQLRWSIRTDPAGDLRRVTLPGLAAMGMLGGWLVWITRRRKEKTGEPTGRLRA
ncbi:MAG: hypothetical protein ACLFV7_07845 [Phycisphaerae bacterium]